MPPLPPPSLPVMEGDCVRCQDRGLGYCVDSRRCNQYSTVACGGRPEFYIAESQAKAKKLLKDHGVVTLGVGLRNNNKPLKQRYSYGGGDCTLAPQPAPTPPSPPPTPPSPPFTPPPPPSPPPSPVAPPPPPLICSNSCEEAGWVADGVCDDGGPGSAYSGCAFGSDCDDCTDRVAPSPPPAPPPRARRSLRRHRCHRRRRPRRRRRRRRWVRRRRPPSRQPSSR